VSETFFFDSSRSKRALCEMMVAIREGAVVARIVPGETRRGTAIVPIADAELTDSIVLLLSNDAQTSSISCRQ